MQYSFVAKFQAWTEWISTNIKSEQDKNLYQIFFQLICSRDRLQSRFSCMIFSKSQQEQQKKREKTEIFNLKKKTNTIIWYSYMHMKFKRMQKKRLWTFFVDSKTSIYAVFVLYNNNTKNIYYFFATTCWLFDFFLLLLIFQFH
jgi:hypothetical protein